MNQITSAKELEFSDLYLGHPKFGQCFSDGGGNLSPVPEIPLLRDDLNQLFAICADKAKKAPAVGEFKVYYDSVDYRMAVLPSMAGNVFVLRRIAPEILSLGELGIPQAYARQMLLKDLTGLFVVTGGVRSGKTSTACAMVKDRLTAYGGVAVTSEAAAELPLEGSYGPGICFQTTAPRGNFSHLLRWGARIILIDEIRDKETAAEVLQASVNGYLIISTMLAETATQAIVKLYTLASDTLAPETSRVLLGDGLAGILQQQLTHRPKLKPQLETELLFLKDAPNLKALVRQGEFLDLPAQIRRQAMSLITKEAVIQRMS